MAVIQSNLTQSGLDEIFLSAYEMDAQPGEIRADNDLFFKQGNTDWLTYQYSESMGPGKFNKNVVDQEVDEATVREGNKTTAEVFEYDQDVPIPQRYQEATAAYDIVTKWIADLGYEARTSRDQWAIEQSYGDSFSGVLTPDGVSLFNNSHTALSGDTVDNLETGAASPDNISVLALSLRLQKGQNGRLASYHLDGLLGPAKLHQTLMEITKSELKANTANNNLNYYSQVYPGLIVGASEWLDGAYNSLNANANTSYFMVSNRHMITRKVRVPISQEYVEPRLSRKRIAYYRARFSERVFPGTWCGTAGSNGTV